jgi:cytochrome b pre-mRNA-processing protein 3
MILGLARERPADVAGRRLYAAAAAQARQQGFYLAAGVPDTPEGRFELYTAHVVLILHRLKRQGPLAAEIGQVVFDTYVSSLDLALRELGVGDLSVGKKMRKLGEAFYGRAKAYDAALETLPDTVPLRSLIARTVLADAEPAGAGLIADYMANAVERFRAQGLEEIVEARLDWPEPPQ